MQIQPGQFGVVIADESHYLKSRDAIRTQCTVPFMTEAAVAVCLSGTPALSCPVELYTQLNAMRPAVCLFIPHPCWLKLIIDHQRYSMIISPSPIGIAMPTNLDSVEM